MSSIVIRYQVLFPERNNDIVSDMRLNPLKMHRILIAYEETAVIVFSLNKNREIQRIHFSEYDKDRGKALAVEYVPGSEGNLFFVGYSDGTLAIYKSEVKSQKPHKVIDIKAKNSYSMTLSIIERPDLYNIVAIHYSCEKPVEFGKSSSLETDIILA